MRDLKRHQSVHTGEKPYLCSKCNIRFSLSQSLRKHERRIQHLSNSAFDSDYGKPQEKAPENQNDASPSFQRIKTEKA